MELRKFPKWQRIEYMPCSPLGADGSFVTACKEHIALSREAATEGAVLLKNENRILPFVTGQKIAVFGKAQADYVKGGGGSGNVHPPYVVGILEGLERKAEEGKLQLFTPLSDYYRAYVAAQEAAPGFCAEPELPDTLVEQARGFTDTAVITVCRFSRESADRQGTPFDGDFYLSHEETAMAEKVFAAFSKVVVLLNSGGMMDTVWIKNNPKVQGAMLVWQPGMEGGNAVADLLCGEANPSGHLTDTFAVNFDAYPSSANFNESHRYVEYQEDIFVGYRYFETIPGAGEKVCYPFGFGLSYTSFEIANAAGRETTGTLELAFSVKNTGDIAGKEVVQLYCAAPQGKLGKAAKVLVGFKKTALLQPGQSQDMTISVPLSYLASFDDEGKVSANAWVLERGSYRFFLGENVRDAAPVAFAYQVAEDTVVEQLTAKCVPHNLTRRLRADGTYEDLPMPKESRPEWVYDPTIPVHILNAPLERPQPITRDPREKQYEFYPLTLKNGKPHFHQLIEVYQGKITLDEFMEQLTVMDMLYLLGGQPNKGSCNTFGWGNLADYGVPNAMTADGPAGLRLKPEGGLRTTCFPCMNMAACTWNTDIMFAIGAAGAAELKENGCGTWLTPAINIHRSPLCGRNFEYYSEDPLQAGLMAAAMISGIQSRGVAACLKHFACNNKEYNRKDSDSVLSQRALREIYLKAFELCVKNAQPWSIMSSYNLINGTHTSANRELLTDILRGEWGFAGLVTTDWFTKVYHYEETKAGNDVKMGVGMPEHSYAMYRRGELTFEEIRTCAKRVLELILKLD